LADCQLTFRYHSLLMALKKDKFQFGIDNAFHKKDMRSQFEQNIKNYFEKMIFELDDLRKMKSEFPNNIPVLYSDEENVDYIEVVNYYEAERQLMEYFKVKTP
jgi:NAD+--asparagine ADP-ribosyltransferase